MKILIIICIHFSLLFCQTLKADNIMSTSNQRYEIGLKNLKYIDQEAGERVLESLSDISPDLGKYIIEYAFGDVYNRKGLDLKSKEIAVVAALTAMANVEPQLKVHMHGALNVGCNIAEVQEVILQMSAYSGFPSSINGMMALKEVLKERKSEGKKDKKGIIQSSPIPKDTTRYEYGSEKLKMLSKSQVEILEQTFKDVSPDMAKFVVEYGFSDIFARPALDSKHREIATIAALTAMGNAPSQLKFHIKAALNIGVSQVEIREIMILMSVYAGFPSAINGTIALKEVIKMEIED
ncbi:carboxymuconolactone decarboxylase family protein [Agaribacter marinus]|uniref:Carboxymuconolactone decarboxylase n=1 Tax=Agaribacter marinus TaxID=1431249 RepID=A0AA37WK19_9ALTE|nr:carboxymuconolactone decarboxylase [Agaribacter marinus]